jgi:hypothetical protein
VGDGFVIVDSGNRRLRQVDGAGTITSVAGVPYPLSVAGTPDGGYAVSTTRGVLMVGGDGVLRAIGGAGRWPADLLGLGDADSDAGFFNGEGRDAGTLGLDVRGLATDPLGGLTFSDGEDAIGMLAHPPSRRMAVAIRRVLGAAKKPRLVLVATTRGKVELTVRKDTSGGRPRVAPITRRRVEPGVNTVRIPRVPAGAYTLGVRAAAANGTRDSDRLGIVLGGHLSIWAAAVAIANIECDCTGDAPDTTEYLGRCRRFSRSRVDCRIDAREIGSCEYVGSAIVRPSGFVWTRQYGCPMRKKPGEVSKLSPAPLL